MDKDPKINLVIVGGGYVGSMAAILASKNPRINVNLIEKDNKLCGLYNNAWEKNNLCFSYGSRAILQTGIDDIDEILNKILPNEEYSKSKDNLKEFSYQNEQVLNYTNCLDARLLPKNLFLSGKAEMLDITEAEGNKNPKNLSQYCKDTYGKIFTEHLFRPAIKKLTGLSLEEVEKDTIHTHGINRIIIADEDESKSLKSKSDFNDSRIAFAKYDNNKSNMTKMLPLNSGYSDFSNRVKKYLQNSENINLHMNEFITDVKFEEKKIIEVHTLSQTIKNIDYILWTIPSPIFAKVLDIDISVLKRPKFRNTIFFHYIFSGQLNTDAYFIYNYDNNFINYRTTLYNNFSNRENDLLSARVEVFDDNNNLDPSSLKDKVFNELKKSKIVSQNSLILEYFSHIYKSSWPAFETGFYNQQQNLNTTIQSKVSNVFMAGKTNGKLHTNALVNEINSFFDRIK